MSTLVQEAPVGFAFVDTDLRYAMVNAHMAEFSGLDIDEHLGRSAAEIVPELGAAIVVEVEQALSSGRSRTHVELAARVEASATIPRTWEGAFYPVEDEDGRRLGVGVVLVEITGRKARELQLETLHRQQRAVASRLQRGLLPQGLPVVAGYQVAARYIAGADQLQVGGDWYDLIDVSPREVAVVVGDVVGHDLDAALAMGRLRNALAGLSHAHADPSEVLRHLDTFASHTPSTFGSTLFYGRLDAASGSLTYSAAGHLPPLVMDQAGRSGRFLDGAQGPVLGIEGARHSAQIVLEPGDTLVGFTDGLVERRDEVIDDGLRRLHELARRLTALDVDQLADALVGSVGPGDRTDDLAVLVVRRAG